LSTPKEFKNFEELQEFKERSQDGRTIGGEPL
jgi:hypothetical protein